LTTYLSVSLLKKYESGPPFAWVIVTFELTLLACPTPGRPEAVRTGEPTLFISMAVLILASDADANDGNSGHTRNSNVCDD
jgi:hypothetical protein